jgi:uncharacterized membrane protein
MANQDITAGVDLQIATEAPHVRKISAGDLADALKKGTGDFLAMPSHVVFVGLIYPVVGLLFWRAATGYEFLSLLYPLVAGFALIGPFAAIGLYELSRRRERGLPTSWPKAFGVFRSRSLPAIAGLGALLMAIFIAWLFAAHTIYRLTLGEAQPASLAQFASDLFDTRAGWTLIIVGNVVGFLFALAAFSISVISFPLLLDRNVGFAAAVGTSLRAVAMNPITMALWGIIVAVLLAVGSLPFLLGLAVVMPILGHSTWHLYRKVVDASASPRAGHWRWNTTRRHAADFPAALYPWAGEKRRL